MSGGLIPIFCPGGNGFSPIEDMTWNAIRCAGIPLYPQIPVLNYFIDFGNPILRVGLEVDGANWHQDVSRDRKRDAWIAREGWHIYRCTGKEVHRVIEIDLDDVATPADIEAFYLTTVEGVLRAIGYVYGIRPMREELRDLCYRTLNEHRLVSFAIGPRK